MSKYVSYRRTIRSNFYYGLGLVDGYAPDKVYPMVRLGFSVLRAATARAIVSSGLHPSLSVHHKSGGDPLSLADDLMEPFRPTIDLCVYELLMDGVTTVDESRAQIVECLSAVFITQNGHSPLSQILVRLAQSTAQSFENGKVNLNFPSQLLPSRDLAND